MLLKKDEVKTRDKGRGHILTSRSGEAGLSSRGTELPEASIWP